MACHKEAESRHEAPAQKAKGKRGEVPAGNTVGSEGDDWAPWNGGAGSFSGSAGRRWWLARVLAGRFGGHDSSEDKQRPDRRRSGIY